MLKKYLRTALAVLAVSVIAAGAVYYSVLRNSEADIDAVMTVLRSESMNFLVTRKIAASAVVERQENSLFLGSSHGLLIADVELLYGFDLNRISRDDLSYQDGTVKIKLPPPELLRTVVDLDSMRYFTKQSTLRALADKLSGQDLRESLRRDFAREAENYCRRKKLIPSEDELCESLRTWAVPFFAEAGIKVAFEPGYK